MIIIIIIIIIIITFSILINCVVDDGDEDGWMNNEETSVTVANGHHSSCHMDCAKDDIDRDDKGEDGVNGIKVMIS